MMYRMLVGRKNVFDYIETLSVLIKRSPAVSKILNKKEYLQKSR